MRTRARRKRTLRDCYHAMHNANTYEEWKTAALETDILEGTNSWRMQDESPDYDYKLIQSRLHELRRYHAEKNIPQLIYSLREGLHRNLGNIMNSALYRYCHSGSKILIETYVNEVSRFLFYLCDLKSKKFPYEEKLLFFENTYQSYGHSALLLSGGAALGVYHIGVLKTLWEMNLLPKVMSGSSIGSFIAAVAGVKTDDEVEAMFLPENVNLFWSKLDLKNARYQKALLNPRILKACILANVGEYTFEEAYERTGRIINITVSPVARNHWPRLVNYLTFPHMFIYSACLASCSIPGLFPPTPIFNKGLNGEKIPYMSGMKWIDGTLQRDLPTRRLSELYNINHFIVSQTNPHIVPFLHENRRQERYLAFLRNTFKEEFQFHGKLGLKIIGRQLNQGLSKSVLEGFYTILDQQYTGDITIYPPVVPINYLHMLSNPTPDDFYKYIKLGERATWPHIVRINNQSRIGHTLKNCIKKLRLQKPHI